MASANGTKTFRRRPMRKCGSCWPGPAGFRWSASRNFQRSTLNVQLSTRWALEGQGFFVQEALQVLEAGGVTDLAQGLGFDLADAFARDLVAFPNFFQGMFVTVLQPEPQL